MKKRRLSAAKTQKIVELILSADSHDPEELCKKMAEIEFGPGPAANLQAERYLRYLISRGLTKKKLIDERVETLQ